MTSALEHIISPASHYRTTELESCVAFFGIQTADIYVLLAPLKAVVDCSNGKDILYLHASLPDFLFDKERSREYYINPVTWSTRLSVMAFKFLEAGGIAGKQGAHPDCSFLKRTDGFSGLWKWPNSAAD